MAATLGAACGGLSERRVDVETDGGTHLDASGTGGTSSGTGGTSSGTNSTAPASTTLADGCPVVCSRCLADALGTSCGSFCAGLASDAAAAGCTAPLTALYRCYESSDACSPSACPTDNNAVTACIIRYCDERPNATLCTAPL